MPTTYMHDIELDRLEESLELPPGFIASLELESDWSFIIKSHAIIESICSTLITNATGKPELSKLFSRLPLGDSEFGKLRFIRDLNLLDESLRKYITSLSELRNKIVHNIENVNFDVTDHFNSLDKNQKTSFIAKFGIGLNNTNDNQELNAKMFKEQPRQALNLSFVYVIYKIELLFLDQVAAKKKAQLADLEAKLFRGTKT